MEKAEEFVPSQAFDLREKWCRLGNSAPGYLQVGSQREAHVLNRRLYLHWMAVAEAPAVFVKQLTGNRKGGKPEG